MFRTLSIRYLSSTPGKKTGMIGVSFIQDGKRRVKTCSWHPEGRSELEALEASRGFIQTLSEINNMHREFIHRECFEIIGDMIDECNEAIAEMDDNQPPVKKLKEALKKAENKKNFSLSITPGEKARTIRLLICNHINDGNHTRASMVTDLNRFFNSDLTATVNYYITELMSPKRAISVTVGTEFHSKVAIIEPYGGRIVWKK